jgi:asparagine synthase (glutamine-hydrolysing)
VKVALSGEGADEFFGGYNIYKEPLDLRIMTDMPISIRKFFAKLVSMIPFSFKGKNFFIRASKNVEERFIGNANMFSVKERGEILLRQKGTLPTEITKPFYDQVQDQDDITKMQYLDIHLWMVGDILLKADKMSMAHSLEVRVPFLDKEVFRVASKIQTDFRVNKQATKYAFRMAAKDHMPQEVADKKKLGFPVPIRIWLKEEKYFNIVRDAFLSEACKKYFNAHKLINYLEDHKKGKRDNSRKIWTVYTFLLWHERFFGQEA